MLHPSDLFMLNRLNERKLAGNFRALKPENYDLIDFSSNDYLGFARSLKLKQLIVGELDNYPYYLNGSTGSRLLTGNLSYAEQLEQQIADIHSHEAALIFNSGYDANIGLFSCLPQRGDTVITDELIHASIIDGIRLSNANRYTFEHNDLQSLEKKLKNAKSNCYVVIESVYSMDGDTPPIADIMKLTRQYNARLIIDEAHAIGVLGKGIIDEFGFQNEFFARIITYGKAMGVHGAVVLGSKILKDFLVNFARSFIYTTAASFHQMAAIKMAYELLNQSEDAIKLLQKNIRLFNNQMRDKQMHPDCNSAIHCVTAGSNERAQKIADKLKMLNIDVRPVLSPTVAASTERLRVCLHAYNTTEDITTLTNALKEL